MSLWSLLLLFSFNSVRGFFEVEFREVHWSIEKFVSSLVYIELGPLQSCFCFMYFDKMHLDKRTFNMLASDLN